MKLLILGPSGGVGRHLVPLAAAEGHEITVITRTDVPFPPSVRVIRDDVLRPGVFECVAGHDVVLSCLGLKRANPNNPWSPLISPRDFNSRTARELCAAMKRHGVQKVVAVSAAGVADSAPSMNWLMKFLVGYSNVGIPYRDLAVMEQIYAESGLDWCCPRPTRLTDGPATNQVRIIDGFPINAAISRADVAAWMLSRVNGGAMTPRTPIVTG